LHLRIAAREVDGQMRRSSFAFRRSLFAGREALAIRRGKARLYADGYCYADGMGVDGASSSRKSSAWYSPGGMVRRKARIISSE